jgi:hypothetical protein
MPSVVWKPVPKMIASTGRSVPSAVCTASADTRVIGSVTSSTFGAESAG